MSWRYSRSEKCWISSSGSRVWQGKVGYFAACSNYVEASVRGAATAEDAMTKMDEIRLRADESGVHPLSLGVF